MAAPVVSTDLTSLTTCEATTGFTALGGGASGLTAETDFYVQGSLCVSKQITVSGTLKGMWYDAGSGRDLSGDNHAFIWLYLSTNQLCASKAAGGLRVRLGGTVNTNYKEWYAYGYDDYIEGGWKRVAIDAGSTPDTSGGTLVTSAVQWYGVQSLVLGTAKAANLGIDSVHFGTGHRITDGDSGSPGNFDSIAAFDDTKAARYGVFYKRNGVYFNSGKIHIGPASGSTACRFDQTQATCFFVAPPVPVKSTFMSFTVSGTGTVVNFTDVSLKSLSPTYMGDFLVKSASSVAITGGVWDTLRTVDFASTVTATALAINNSGLVVQNSAVFTGCVFDSAAGPVGMLCNDPSKLTSCEFISKGTGHALQFNTAGTYTFSGNTFSGYASISGSTGNEAVYNTSGGLVTLNVTAGGGTPSVRNGGVSTTVINNNIQVTLTGLINPTEVRVYLVGTATEIGGQESVTTGSFVFSSTAGTIVDIRIFSVSYEPADILNYSIPVSDSSIPISQRFDRNYANP